MKEHIKTMELDPQKTKTSKSDSKIDLPDDLTPVCKWKNGYTNEEALMFRQAYLPESLETADDIGNYAASRTSEIYDTATVHRCGPVANLDKDINVKIGEVVAETTLGRQSLQKMMHDEGSRMKAIAVIHDGKVVFEEYLGIREYDDHLWASATKILNGILIHISEEKGFVDLKKGVTHYLPELKETNWEITTVGDVLHQRSGLDVSESNSVNEDHPVAILYAIAAGDTSKGASLFEAIKGVDKADYLPGNRYEYASINTFVLTLILERVWKKPIEDIITEQIWSKIGAEGDAVMGLSARGAQESTGGEALSFGVYASRLRDLARFGMLFTPSWSTIAEDQVVSNSYFLKVVQEAKTEIYGEDYMSQRLINDFEETNIGTSYQWDAVFADGDMYKSGRTGQCLYVSPETNTVVVWFSSSYKAEVWVHAYARAIVNDLFRKK